MRLVEGKGNGGEERSNSGDRDGTEIDAIREAPPETSVPFGMSLLPN